MWRYRCVRYWYRRKSIRNRRYIIIPFIYSKLHLSFYLPQTYNIHVKNGKISLSLCHAWENETEGCTIRGADGGILALLSVVIPHHHHRDGMPCYQSLTRSKRMAIKALIRMIAVATGITWPISVRIFLILWMEMWIYIWCRYSSYLITFIHLNRRFADSSLITRTPPTLSRCTTLG